MPRRQWAESWCRSDVHQFASAAAPLSVGARDAALGRPLQAFPLRATVDARDLVSGPVRVAAYCAEILTHLDGLGCATNVAAAAAAVATRVVRLDGSHCISWECERPEPGDSGRSTLGDQPRGVQVGTSSPVWDGRP